MFLMFNAFNVQYKPLQNLSDSFWYKPCLLQVYIHIVQTMQVHLWDEPIKEVLSFLFYTPTSRLSNPQIISQRLADQIPLVIRYQMLQETAVQLQRQMLQILQDNGKSGSLLQEDCGIKARRMNLQDCVKRLSKARSQLTEFSMNMYNFSTSWKTLKDSEFVFFADFCLSQIIESLFNIMLWMKDSPELT